MLVLVFIQTCFAQGRPVVIEELPKKKPKKQVIPSVVMIDDFEDGKFNENPVWWQFGNLTTKVVNNKDKEKFLGQISTTFNGKASNWYAGGFGTYTAKDLRFLTNIKIVIYSPHINAGMIKLEFYDDDNNNQVVDIDDDTKRPSKDDIFTTTFILDWKGWKVVNIPISRFVDDICP